MRCSIFLWGMLVSYDQPICSIRKRRQALDVDPNSALGNHLFHIAGALINTRLLLLRYRSDISRIKNAEAMKLSLQGDV